MRRLIATAAAVLLALAVAPVAVASAGVSATAAAPATARTAEPPTLRFGDVSPAVTVLQRALGVPVGKGMFNRATERAVKALQARHGVRRSGIVGPITWGLLGPKVSRAAARFAVSEPDSSADALPWTTFAGRDMVGYRPSTYRGKYFDPRFEQYRLCVVQRESGGRYSESSGSHIGAYQFSYSLAASARRALRVEMGDVFGRAGLDAVDALAGTAMSSWPRYFQDAAFWTIFNRGAGWSHWSSRWGANWNCDHRPNAESGWPNRGYWNYSPLEG